MAHHKRGRTKSRRAGCLLCKPHKANGCEVDKPGVQRQLQDDVLELVAGITDLDEHDRRIPWDDGWEGC